jgi:hypothetical protein
LPTSGRVRPGQQPCVGVWPITGSTCKNPAEDGYGTCAAHDPDGDRRPPPPADEQRCTATNKESGERCRRKHITGGKVCRSHGGNAKQNRAAAGQRTADKKARALVATYGLPIDIAPDQAILDEVHRTAGHVAWLERQVHALTEGELVWGITRVKEGGEDRGTTEEAVPNALLRLYNEERDRLVRVCTAALKAGIEERRVKLAERDGALIAEVIRAILDDLKLTSKQWALVSTVVPQHLRALALAN